MSARPTIYSGPLSMFGAKVQIAALEKGLDFDLVMVPYDSARGYDPKHPEVLRINPKRQVPVLTHGPVEIFDSTQIFEYLEDMAPTPPLWPRDPIARAVARNLEHQSDEVYFPHIIKLMGLQDALATEPAVTAIEGANRFYAAMEDRAEFGMARRQLLVRGHRFLHGRVVWRAAGRAIDRGHAAPACVARAHGASVRR